MSVSAKLAANREFLHALKRWPEDSHKVFVSFKQAQLKLYEQPDIAKLPSVDTIKLRTTATNELVDNVNFKKFTCSERMFHPDGNPGYYKMIVQEANRRGTKVGRLQAMREALFGWWKG